MNFSVIERADREVSEASGKALALSLHRELRKVSEECRRIGNAGFEIKSVYASFGSVLRDDTASVSFRPDRHETGYVIEADVSYSPSAWFWVFCVIDILLMGCFFGFFVMWLTLWLYYDNRSMVESGISQALKRAVRNAD